jgi:transcriptional regulator with XRE-family HTH domain
MEVMLMRVNQIDNLRKDRGWSIYELTRRTGLQYNTVYPLVKADTIPGGTRYSTLQQIAAVFGVLIDDLEKRNGAMVMGED